MNVNKKTSTIAKLGVLAAISVILVALIHISISILAPIFPPFAFLPFLEYDPADIPIFLGTFALGPVAGVALTLIASVIQGLTVSSQSGIYGIIMHLIATGAYVIVAGNIYKHIKTKKGAVIALVCGTIAMALVMIPANLFITPVFMGVDRAAVASLLLWIVFFNIIKAGVNSIVTFFVYKRVSPILHK